MALQSIVFGFQSIVFGSNIYFHFKKMVYCERNEFVWIGCTRKKEKKLVTPTLYLIGLA